MQGLKQMLLQEQLYLENIVNKAYAGLASVPEGSLRISVDRNRIRYYHCLKGNKERYIPQSDKQLPNELAQKTYYLSVIRKAESRLKQIRVILNDYSEDEIEKLFTSLHENRQALISPVELTWKQRLDRWCAEKYQGKEFREGAAVILTERGERVRSKSEKILADYFYRKGIPYKYEKPLCLKGYGIVYPDFTFLSKQTGQEIYWEHEGMMDKSEYANAAVRKIESYQKSGIYPGERLILTFETEQCVLNSNVIDSLVKRYLDFFD